MIHVPDFEEYLERLQSVSPQDADLFFTSIERYCNNLVYSPDKTAKKLLEDDKLADNAKVLALAWISYVRGGNEGNRGVGTDARNAFSVNRCVKICDEFPDVSRYINDRPVFKRLLSPMRSMHKTLMQSFTGTMLSIIHFCNNSERTKAIDAFMTNEYGPYWYECPFI